MEKVNILMVCLGNICRSPLAEGILKSKLDTEKFHIDSAGTSGHHTGELPDSRSIAIARDNGLDITDQRSRKFTKSDFNDFDYIYVMDNNNYNDVTRLTNNENEKRKVKLILNEISPKRGLDVPDPYYGGEDGFKKVFEMLDEACDVIAKKIRYDR